MGTAVLIEAGRIVAVGGSELTRLDVDHSHHEGGVIVPGLRDAHLHPVGYAASLHRPSLKRAADLGAVADILRDAVDRQAPGTAVAALRLDDESLAEGRLPDRRFLDGVVADRPVLLMRYCGHVAVGNTAALEAAGVTPATPDPVGGSFDRDASGVPNGIARETAAEVLSLAIRGLAPPVTSEDLSRAVEALATLGITAIGGMVAVEPGCWAGSGSEIDALINASGDLAIRVRAFVIANTPDELRQAAERIESAGGKIGFGGVKMFGDGSLGGHTAAMHEPFADLPTERGTHRLEHDRAVALGKASVELGGRVAIHAIGDAANGRALDVLDELIRLGADPALLRIEHASVLKQADIERFGRLGVTASVQPAFMASETTWLESRVGPERLETTYAFRSLAENGVPLAGGSDCPVEPPYPVAGMAAARDRCGIVPAQALSPEQALALFTNGSAAAIGETAQLTPGSPADLTVLDTDPVTATPDAVRTAGVLATFVEGAEVPRPSDVVTWAD
jgi:predicted amidohydrolase YtcJ